MNKSKLKKLEMFFAFYIVIIGIVFFGRYDYINKIGFLITIGSVSLIIIIVFIIILVITWNRWVLRISSFLLFLSICSACCISNLDFSFREAIIISSSIAFFPFSFTFIFYEKERKEKLKERGFGLEPIQYFDGNFGKEILVLYGKDMEIIHVDKKYREIL